MTVGHDVWIGHRRGAAPACRSGSARWSGRGRRHKRRRAVHHRRRQCPPDRFATLPRRRGRRDHVETAWWDWPREVLEERIGDFNDLETFLKKYAR